MYILADYHHQDHLKRKLVTSLSSIAMGDDFVTHAKTFFDNAKQVYERLPQSDIIFAGCIRRIISECVIGDPNTAVGVFPVLASHISAGGRFASDCIFRVYSQLARAMSDTYEDSEDPDDEDLTEKFDAIFRSMGRGGHALS